MYLLHYTGWAWHLTHGCSPSKTKHQQFVLQLNNLSYVSLTLHRLGVAFDPWLFPIKDKAPAVCAAVKQPLLCISTETFQTQANLKAMSYLPKETSSFVTIKYVYLNNILISIHIKLSILYYICIYQVCLF